MPIRHLGIHTDRVNDTETGVNYLLASTSLTVGCGMTVLVDKDGKPIIIPIFIKHQTSGFYLNLFTRTFTNDNGENVYLTAKEFDLLYFSFAIRGRYSRKSNFMKMSGVSAII